MFSRGLLHVEGDYIEMYVMKRLDSKLISTWRIIQNTYVLSFYLSHIYKQLNITLVYMK